MTELDPYSGNIEHLARAYGATHKEDTYAVGVIVGYCPVPSYAIRRYDGTEFWWRADLVEVSDEVITKNDNRYPDRAKSGSHYIIYESDIAGAVGTREAVCYCGARFASKMAVTGTIGEMFASHIRQLRVREVADAEEARRRAERFGKNEDN